MSYLLHRENLSNQNLPKHYFVLQNYVVSHTFYPDFPLFLHRYICHICDISQLCTTPSKCRGKVTLTKTATKTPTIGKSMTEATIEAILLLLLLMIIILLLYCRLFRRRAKILHLRRSERRRRTFRFWIGLRVRFRRRQRPQIQIQV